MESTASVFEKAPTRLPLEGITLSIRTVDTVPSTNTALRQAAEQGMEEGEVLVALHQSAGRGSAGRSFYSPESTGLYFSILLRPELAPIHAGYLTMAAAVAVARALTGAGCPDVKIKWVNDLYKNGRKIAGILTEASFDTASGRFRYAVVGVGINLTAPAGGFPEELRTIAGAAFDVPVDRDALLIDILKEFFALYRALPDHSFMEEYLSRSCLVGKQVTVTAGDRTFCGTVATIDTEGGLHVRDGEGNTAVFRSGTVRAEEPLL